MSKITTLLLKSTLKILFLNSNNSKVSQNVTVCHSHALLSKTNCSLLDLSSDCETVLLRSRKLYLQFTILLSMYQPEIFQCEINLHVC